jgi:hypothetical protein
MKGLIIHLPQSIFAMEFWFRKFFGSEALLYPQAAHRSISSTYFPAQCALHAAGVQSDFLF